MLIMKPELKEISITKNDVFVFSQNTTAHDLIEHILKQTGPAEIFVSSFSITEPAVRRFINLQEEGYIKNMACMFDKQVKRHHLQTLFLMSNFIDEIFITSNHSKVTLIKNENHHISIVSSANLNENNKIEAGAIFIDRETHEKLTHRFISEIDKSVKIERDDLI